MIIIRKKLDHAGKYSSTWFSIWKTSPYVDFHLLCLSLLEVNIEKWRVLIVKTIKRQTGNFKLAMKDDLKIDCSLSK